MFWTCIVVEIVDDVTQPQKRKGGDVRTKCLAWSASLTFCVQGEISVVCLICACASSCERRMQHTVSSFKRGFGGMDDDSMPPG